MIRLADDTSKQDVWNMWKTVFGDPDNYMDIYFRTKYKNENTLIYFEEEKPVASLQMLEFDFSFYGVEIPIYYLSGVCTLPEARRKGYMDKLLIRSFEIARDRNIPLMILVPQEEWLISFYDKYGFAQTFDEGVSPLISLKELSQKYGDELELAYKDFDAQFRDKDMTVQKSFDDFLAIMEESSLWDYPEKKNLIGMSRIIDADALLSIYAEQNKVNSFRVDISDEIIIQNNTTFGVNISDESPNSYELNIRALAQLLLGYKMREDKDEINKYFSKKHPQINFMLE